MDVDKMIKLTESLCIAQQVIEQLRLGVKQVYIGDLEKIEADVNATRKLLWRVIEGEEL